MARTTYRIEHSKDGSDWRTFMAWSGLQKCRAEGAFGILMSMYDGVWYRLVEEGGQVIEVSHHAVPSVGKKAERVFTESEVRAYIAALKDETMFKSVDEMLDRVARRVLSLDPA